MVVPSWNALQNWWKRLCSQWQGRRSQSQVGQSGQGQRLGPRGEQASVRYLKKLGWKIVGTNVRSVMGEVDIIALDSGCLVFLEVKTRSNTHRGEGHEAVGLAKQRQISRCAAYYLRTHSHSGAVRFDVLSLLWPETEPQPEIRHFRHAFECIDGID